MTPIVFVYAGALVETQLLLAAVALLAAWLKLDELEEVGK